MAAQLVKSPLGLMRAASAGLDPVGFFRRHAAQPCPFELSFPGLGQVTFFGTPDAARDILTVPANLSEAPTPNPIEAVVGPGSLILLSGEQHRRERSLLQPAFHGERIKSYGDIIAAATADEIRSVRPGESIGVRELAVAITLHVAIRVVFSVADADRRTEYTRAVTALMRANTAPLMLVPALRHELGGHGPWARLVRLRDDLDRLLSDDMALRQPDSLAGADMLDVLLSAVDPDATGEPGLAIHDQLRTLLAAGHETTATSMMWALYHIYRDESVRARVAAELAHCRTPAEITALPYLGAVIKEALRLHPPVPIVLRRLKEPLTVGGVDCAAGKIVGIALYALHFNPSVWPDPDLFDPDRFLRSRISPFEYAPFGGGYRRCIGAAFASCELAVAIATIMQTLELRMPEREQNRREPRSVARGIAVAPAREITLDVIDRQPVAVTGGGR
ncbi:cytochrome P450 [Mycolicibacterium mageritense DSM 44476 = CIP 104973]|uniref:Cytochrome P450 n=1 Tax=Mycolicibacterium mageritense TaxID=53462 RepID=A0AAI8XRP3_MYCME|nr:cytochrome P450 [Mycolicibacterium mageritense]MBN3458827.1 cytochrome P450 [Mycobacterium sp. DSM 3803]TXI52274.1 MAG: cytochrome P450 [Mycolicibacterium mageritense]CDO25695.1 cytochrome P450 [Mycolicibacterium mageritense DSM 44476 = CIP 104973]BBX37641.1 cytochrome P450 [Mycolicibacterium mageritense]BDY32351.1 Putative cytochrome P450 135A1 [Mycolicibacterium mageritense]